MGEGRPGQGTRAKVGRSGSGRQRSISRRISAIAIVGRAQRASKWGILGHGFLSFFIRFMRGHRNKNMELGSDTKEGKMGFRLCILWKCRDIECRRLQRFNELRYMTIFRAVHCLPDPFDTSPSGIATTLCLLYLSQIAANCLCIKLEPDTTFQLPIVSHFIRSVQNTRDTRSLRDVAEPCKVSSAPLNSPPVRYTGIGDQGEGRLTRGQVKLVKRLEMRALGGSTAFFLISLLVLPPQERRHAQHDEQTEALEGDIDDAAFSELRFLIRGEPEVSRCFTAFWHESVAPGRLTKTPRRARGIGRGC